MKNSLGISQPIHMGKTCMPFTQSASKQYTTTCAERFQLTCISMQVDITACAACPSFTSSASPSVAPQISTTAYGCIQRSISPRWRSHTGGHERGLVSFTKKDNSTIGLKCEFMMLVGLWCQENVHPSHHSHFLTMQSICLMWDRSLGSITFILWHKFYSYRTDAM